MTHSTNPTGSPLGLRGLPCLYVVLTPGDNGGAEPSNGTLEGIYLDPKQARRHARSNSHERYLNGGPFPYCEAQVWKVVGKSIRAYIDLARASLDLRSGRCVVVSDFDLGKV